MFLRGHVRDSNTGRPKGIAFVEMPLSTQAEAAIKALNGQIFHQPTRTLTVNEARPRPGRTVGNVGQRPSTRVDRLKLLKRSRVYPPVDKTSVGSSVEHTNHRISWNSGSIG